MIKLVIFDWDDVFTRGSIEGYYKCYHKAVEGVGINLDPMEEEKRIKARWGAGHEEQLEYILQEHPELVPRAVEIYQENLFGNTFVDCLTIVPGSQAFLARLAKKYQLAIATGAHPRILKERLIPKFNIPDVFARIITIYDLEDIAHAKPHPAIVNKVMGELGVTPSETVLVGDAASDMQLAWNAGVQPIAVLTGHLTRRQAEELGVRHIIDNVTLLEAELARL